MANEYAVLTFWQIKQSFGYIIELTTDVPCHLWLRYTHVKPDKHFLPEVIRGYWIVLGTRFCFVGWRECEQHEPGDTLIHSFNLRLEWWFDIVYFYSIGQIDGIDSPSTSPIMYLPVRAWNKDDYSIQVGMQYVNQNVSFNRPVAMMIPLPFDRLISGIEILVGATDPNRRARLAVFETDIFDHPKGGALSYCELDHLPYKRPYGLRQRILFPLPPFSHEPGGRYAVILYGDPSHPDDDTLQWSVKARPPDIDSVWSYRADSIWGGYVWHKNFYYVNDLVIWYGIPYYPPTSEHPHWPIHYPTEYPPPVGPLWWEDWHRTLSYANPWETYFETIAPAISIGNSIITIDNLGDLHSGVRAPIAHQSIPVQLPQGQHTFLSYHCPSATGIGENWYISVAVAYDTLGGIWMLEAIVDRGNHWGPWGLTNARTAYGVASDMGKGPMLIDLTQWYKDSRNLYGLDDTTSHVYAYEIFLNFESVVPSDKCTLRCDYVGIKE